MKVEPVYNKLNGAPMRFHKFLCVMVWIGILRNLADFFTTVGDFQGINAYLVVWIIVTVLNIACVFIAGVDLPSMKWLGVKAYFASFGISVATYVVNLVFSALYGLDLYEPTVQLVACIIGSCVFVIPIYIYYGKRRNLFEPYPEVVYSVGENRVESAKDFEPAGRDIAIEEKEESLFTDDEPEAVEEESGSQENIDSNDAEIIREIYDEQVETEIDEEAIGQTNIGDISNKPEFDRVKFCFKCGHEIGPDAVFCEKCGNRVR